MTLCHSELYGAKTRKVLVVCASLASVRRSQSRRFNNSIVDSLLVSCLEPSVTKRGAVLDWLLPREKA